MGKIKDSVKGVSDNVSAASRLIDSVKNTMKAGLTMGAVGGMFIHWIVPRIPTVTEDSSLNKRSRNFLANVGFGAIVSAVSFTFIGLIRTMGQILDERKENQQLAKEHLQHTAEQQPDTSEIDNLRQALTASANHVPEAGARQEKTWLQRTGRAADGESPNHSRVNPTFKVNDRLGIKLAELGPRVEITSRGIKPEDVKASQQDNGGPIVRH